MQDWHHRRSTDLGLRLGGVALCGVSWLAIRTLVHTRLAPWPASPGLMAFGLAAVGFICASAGAALLSIGHHIFDEIEIGERWRTRTIVERSETPASTNESEDRDPFRPGSVNYHPPVVALRRHG